MIRNYALEQGSTLLRRLAFRISRAPKLQDPESIHDLRVAVRRFQQYLRVFHQFFPRGEMKRIRRRLRKIMNLSAEVRNRDIALELLRQAGAPADGNLRTKLARQRQKTVRHLAGGLEEWRGRDPSRKWRLRLEL